MANAVETLAKHLGGENGGTQVVVSTEQDYQPCVATDPALPFEFIGVIDER